MKKELFLDIPDFELFDFHCHVSNMEEFEKDRAKFKIKKFCLMPTVIENDFNDIKSYIEKIRPFKEKYGDRAFIFGLLDFSKDKEANEKLLSEQKTKIKIQGVKIHPEQGFELNKNFLKPYFRAITDALGQNTPIYIHTDWPLLEEKGFQPNGLKDTFNKFPAYFPEFSFIMGHAGGSADYLKIWKTCKMYPNVHVETSMAPSTTPLEEVIWKIGPQRLLFGSNYPYCGTSIEIVKVFSLYHITDTDKKFIFNSNAEVLFS